MSIHDDPRYEWNPAKARANARAHGVDFVEAASASRIRKVSRVRIPMLPANAGTRRLG